MRFGLVGVVLVSLLGALFLQDFYIGGSGGLLLQLLLVLLVLGRV